MNCLFEAQYNGNNCLTENVIIFDSFQFVSSIKFLFFLFFGGGYEQTNNYPHYKCLISMQMLYLMIMNSVFMFFNQIEI